ncbi:MAG TPA: hypothetical protein VGI40_25565 [Pirellulaceae bacterium]
MATTYPDIALTPDLASLLAGLRRRIRVYIWAEGIALALIWLGLMFWFGLALDYLPVLMGASEMPIVPRAVLLAANGLALAYILYRWIGRRIFVPLGDRSLALVLERRFDNFNDSLVTAVEMAGLPEHASAFNRELLARTAQEARAGAETVQYRQVFNKRSLAEKIGVAVLVCGSMLVFMATNTQAFDQAVQRLYLLSDEPWPRSAKIEVVGIEVLRNNTASDEGPRATMLEFEDRVLKVARGANVSLKVRALQPPDAKFVPQYCTIQYRTQSSGAGVRGERGSVNMNNFRDTDDFRNFWFDGKPFKGVLSTIEFDVIGYDHRLSGYKLEVVDSPAVVETLLDIVSPKYMVDEATSSHLPITNQPYLPSGTFIPVGSQVTIKFKANKPLRWAEIRSSDGNDARVIDIPATAKDAQQFAYSIDSLKASTTLEIALLDADNVAIERPYRVFLTAVEDQPPHIDVALRGIGSAVTPDVMIPFRGKITDDYGVAKTWCEVQVDDRGDEVERPFELRAGGAIEQVLDFRNERIEKTKLALAPNTKLLLAVKAADKFDLAGEPHVAVGDRYQLDVVTPEDLLAQLEVREIGLRRRFELIIDEMTQMRDSLLRLKASLASSDSAADESRGDLDLDTKQLTPEQKEQRAAELRQLRVQRATQQSQKSVAEVQGVAAGFLTIREELINNRVDTEDRKNRLKEQIADPLNKTCSEQFPRLDERLAALESQLAAAGAKAAAEATGQAADQAVDQANTVLSELEAVLSKMQDLETYNELLDIVRDLLKDQQKLIERTQQERKRQTLEELKKLE